MSDIQVTPYQKHLHYPTIAMWFEEQGLPVPPPEMLPKVGYFVGSTCAGFLYQTDAGLAIIEGLISSPHSSMRRRNAALNLVIDALTRDAQDLGFKAIWGISKIKGVHRRARNLGWETLPASYALSVRRF